MCPQSFAAAALSPRSLPQQMWRYYLLVLSPGSLLQADIVVALRAGPLQCEFPHSDVFKRRARSSSSTFWSECGQVCFGWLFWCRPIGLSHARAIWPLRTGAQPLAVASFGAKNRIHNSELEQLILQTAQHISVVKLCGAQLAKRLWYLCFRRISGATLNGDRRPRGLCGIGENSKASVKHGEDLLSFADSLVPTQDAQ